MDVHDSSVAALARHISRFHAENVSFRIHHGSTNSTRPTHFHKDRTVDTGSLNHVLRTDPVTKTCLCEPNVPMDALLAATLAHNLVPPVVPEFPGITVGGAFAGTAGESSSFKYGFFDRTVNWVEIVLASGEIVVASEDERTDLFRGAAGTFGTLGVLTLLEIRLIDAKRFVELSYHPVGGVADAQRTLTDVMADETTDFVDGIMFAKNQGVVMSGRLVDRPSTPDLDISTFSRAADPWFYLHAQDAMGRAPNAKTESAYVELVPLKDYLFRYDRGAFWTGRYCFKYFFMPFNWLTRWILDYFMHTRVMYHALHRSGLIRAFIVQDMALPEKSIEEFVAFMDEELTIYPLWLCPLVTRGRVSMSPHFESDTSDSDEEVLLNIGVWGPCPGNDHVATNRKIEARLKELRGMKWLYAQTFYTEEEFWEIYDKRWYDGLRQEYAAQGLPSVYDKVKIDLDSEMKAGAGIWNIWPVRGVYGVLSALKGANYLTRR